ncbi:hypothetical protein CFAM422_011711 [Trichoderma lentiforme]|uniref:Uncharacterized protein n=1 Tax=Trichoderma lentiforme TaxID=1567552 RepID=A0A9P5C787_9HYPO|nr:hypothetical protein CFAM422_011711 [Trichoderma lentiforme]
MPQIRSFPIPEQSDAPISDARRAITFSQWLQQRKAEEQASTSTPTQDGPLPVVRKRKLSITKDEQLDSWIDALDDNPSDMLDADIAAEPPVDAVMGSFDTGEHREREIRTDAEVALDMVNRVLVSNEDEMVDEAPTEVVDNINPTDQEGIQFTIEHEYPDDNGFDEDNIDPEDIADCETHTLADSTPQTAMEPPPSWPCRKVEDFTDEVIHTVKTPQLSVFATALTIWEEQQSITREGHRQLVEILQLVNSLEELRELPLRKDTLRHNLRQSMPLITLRKRTLDLDKTLVPSRASLKEDMLVFDMRSVLRAFLSSETNLRNIYRGMAQLIDGDISEPWEARWWGESIRTTSGQYAYDEYGEPLWPSDFIEWKCTSDSCETYHLGRITYCGMDYRRQAAECGQTGRHILEVQNVFHIDALPEDILAFSSKVDFSQLTTANQELIVVSDTRELIEPKQVKGRLLDVKMDYDFNPVSPPHEPLTASHTVRYFFDMARKDFRPTRLSTPLRGEKEIMVYGRPYLKKHFVDKPVVSLPFFMFADAFGLYRNMYRSLEGIYLIPQYMGREVRLKRKSLLPLTLGPFAANDADIFESLFHMCELDAGTELHVKGEKMFVCSFVGAILGDMPSQQKLSGCLSHMANKPCRYCLISSDERANLDFNIVGFGRYGEQLKLDSKQIKAMQTKTKQETAASALGISVKWRLLDVLDTLFPTLDRIRSRPVDAAHSEYQGLTKVLLSLIFTEILTTEGAECANEAFRTLPFPPTWRRLQSPLRHLDSWRMQELARGCIILPIVLRCCLKEKHIKENIRPVLVTLAPGFFNFDSFTSYSPASFRSTEWVTAAAWRFAQSVLCVCGPYSSSKKDLMPEVIQNGRRAIQFLLQACSTASLMKAPKARRKPAPRLTQKQTQRFPPSEANFSQVTQAQTVTSIQNTVAESAAARNPEAGDSNSAMVVVTADKSKLLKSKMKLPNIHIGLHHAEVAEEYGGCRMVFTLQGEDKHREYKSDILSTNFRNAAVTLINRENHRLTVTLLFDNCFSYEYPDIQSIFTLIKKKCPLLTASLSPRAGEEFQLENEDDSDLPIYDDDEHRKPLALHRIKKGEHRDGDGDSFLAITKLRNLERDHAFLQQLRVAYSRDYGVPLIISFGSQPLQWCRKVAFTPR